jgi:hypothetical protein
LNSYPAAGFFLPDNSTAAFEVLAGFRHVEVQQHAITRRFRADDIEGQSAGTYVVEDSAGAGAVHGDVESRGNQMANVTAVSIHAVVFAITCFGRLIGGAQPLGGLLHGYI